MSIHHAAKSGDLNAIRRELDRGVPVDLDDEYYGTPLAVAARSRAAGADVVWLLLSRGANPNPPVRSLEGPPLFQAAKGGDVDRVRVLLEAGADARFHDSSGITVLVMAAYGDAPNLPEVARVLVAAGAPLDATSQYGESPLSVSSHNGRFDVVKLLLDAGADPAPLRWTPLMRAVAVGAVRDVEDRLRGGGDRSARDRWDRTAWLLAAHAGDVAKAKLLLYRGADRYDLAHTGQPALSLAAARDHVEMVRFLLDAGADVDAADEYRKTPLMAAAQHGAERCVRLLLERGANVHAEDHVREQAVNAATAVAVLRALLEAGADINYVDGTGYWPLKSAAEDGDVERVAFLLKAGAAAETTTAGQTALHVAASFDQVAIVRMLLDAGARVNVLDVDGYSPLHEAKSAEVARVLLDAGADVNLMGGIIGESALEHHGDNEQLFPLLRDAARERKS